MTTKQLRQELERRVALEQGRSELLRQLRSILVSGPFDSRYAFRDSIAEIAETAYESVYPAPRMDGHNA